MQGNEEYQIEIDDLAVGLTRSPMFLGVMLQVAVINMLLCTLAYVYLKTLYVVPFFALLHLIAARFSIKEPRFLEIYYKWITKTPPVLNVLFWGKCNSYLPE